jgi:hypothetical protein
MSTHRLPILGHAGLPDTSGDVFQEPFAIKLTNDQYAQLIWIFQDSNSVASLGGNFQVPQNYIDTANLVVVWTSTATSGTCTWDFDYRAIGGNDTETLDPSSDQQNATGTDTAPTTTGLKRMEFTIALTDGNFAIGDTVQFHLSRDSVTDSMAADAVLVAAFFEYNDA